jgi:hypothetical protein
MVRSRMMTLSGAERFRMGVAANPKCQIFRCDPIGLDATRLVFMASLIRVMGWFRPCY